MSAAAATLLFGIAATASAQEMPSAQGMMHWTPTAMVLFEKLELAPGAQDRPVVVEGVAWAGGAKDRLWIRGRGDRATTESGSGEAEIEALYGRLLTPFFDGLVGLRIDRRLGGGATRALLGVGLDGLAPLWWEVAPTLFVSQKGDISARLEASDALLFSQRLILEPRIEVNAALQDVPEFGIGSGLGEVELGARLRYEIARKLGPYIGVTWVRRFGRTAGLAAGSGEPTSDFSLVAGLRLWR